MGAAWLLANAGASELCREIRGLRAARCWARVDALEGVRVVSYFEPDLRGEASQILAAKDAEVADLKDQLEELRQLILQQQGEPEDDDDAPEKPKRRGRPSKTETIEVTA